MQIFDNILTPKLFENLQNSILNNPNFPWYYGNTSDKSVKPSNNFMYSWDHNVFMDGRTFSDTHAFIEPCLLSALDNCNIDCTKIFRIRLGCITITEKHYIHGTHVDYSVPHKTGLLYLNTANGPTILYNEKYDSKSNLSTTDYFEKNVRNKLTVQDEVDHKENRLLVFDGLTYHSSSTQTDVPRRVAINFNFN
jgi:hypothetical protein